MKQNKINNFVEFTHLMSQVDAPSKLVDLKVKIGTPEDKRMQAAILLQQVNRKAK